MRDPAEILGAVRGRFPGMENRPVDPAPQVVLDAARLRETMSWLRDDLGFDYLVFVSALDRPAESSIELVYRLFSYASRLSLVVRLRVPREGGRVPTVSDLYRTAEWHERETAELFGVEFTGHPDPRRLLLPDDLEGYPLRKDFTHPNIRRLPEVTEE